MILQERKKVNASVSVCAQKEVHRRVCECATTMLCECGCECCEWSKEDLQLEKEFAVGQFARVVNQEDLEP